MLVGIKRKLQKLNLRSWLAEQYSTAVCYQLPEVVRKQLHELFILKRISLLLRYKNWYVPSDLGGLGFEPNLSSQSITKNLDVDSVTFFLESDSNRFRPKGGVLIFERLTSCLKRSFDNHLSKISRRIKWSKFRDNANEHVIRNEQYDLIRRHVLRVDSPIESLACIENCKVHPDLSPINPQLEIPVTSSFDRPYGLTHLF